jgi:hypothetical protein
MILSFLCDLSVDFVGCDKPMRICRSRPRVAAPRRPGSSRTVTGGRRAHARAIAVVSGRFGIGAISAQMSRSRVDRPGLFGDSSNLEGGGRVDERVVRGKYVVQVEDVLVEHDASSGGASKREGGEAYVAAVMTVQICLPRRCSGRFRVRERIGRRVARAVGQTCQPGIVDHVTGEECVERRLSTASDQSTVSGRRRTKPKTNALGLRCLPAVPRTVQAARPARLVAGRVPRATGDRHRSGGHSGN